MRILLFPILLLFSIALQAQPSTEVYLFDLDSSGDQIRLSNPLNVSDNAGYDNQPSFSPDGRFLFYASTRNGQTDILRYEISSGTRTWLSDTEGGEYSPQLTPDGNYVSAVRLDPDGLQRLYRYPIAGGESEVLIEDLVVGYYTWFFNNRIVSFVLGEPATLRTTTLNDQETTLIMNNPGRSIHMIPGTKKFSYIDRNDADRWMIMEAVPQNQEYTKAIIPAVQGSDDMAWINMHTILMGQGSMLYAFDRRTDAAWEAIADLSAFDLTGITRLAVHSGAGKVAIVVEGD